MIHNDHIPASAFGYQVQNATVSESLTIACPGTNLGLRGLVFDLMAEPTINALYVPPSDWDKMGISVRLQFGVKSTSGMNGSVYVQCVVYGVTASGAPVQLYGNGNEILALPTAAGSHIVEHTPEFVETESPDPFQTLRLEASIINEDSTGVDEVYFLGAVVTLNRTVNL